MAVMSPQPPVSIHPHEQKPLSTAVTPASAEVKAESEGAEAMDLDLHGTIKQDESTSNTLDPSSPKDEINSTRVRSPFVNGNSTKGITAPPSPPIPTPPLHNSTDGTQDLSDLHITSPAVQTGNHSFGDREFGHGGTDNGNTMDQDDLFGGGAADGGDDGGEEKKKEVTTGSSDNKGDSSNSKTHHSTTSVSSDKSMTDVPQSTKTPRDREDDDGDGRPLKRAKTEEGSDVKPSYVPAANGFSTEMTERQRKHAMQVIRSLRRTKDARPFSMPVDAIKLSIPTYYQVITNPMDLQTMERKLNNKEYPTIQAFVDDFNLIMENCEKFNGPEHPVTALSKAAQAIFERQMQELPAADAEPEKPKNSKKKGASGHTAKVATVKQAPAPAPARPAATKAPKSNHTKKDSRSAAQPPVGNSGSPTFGLQPSGIPQIRRDSTAGDGRPKREIHPPAPKDLPYSDVKPRRKKNAIELKFCDSIIKELLRKQHETYAFPFYQPVDPVALNIPDYFKIIKKPMDLGTIQSKLKTNQYDSANDFEADMRLMFNNCYKFNPANQAVHVMGKRLEGVFDLKWAEKSAYTSQHHGSRSPVSVSPPPEEEEEDEMSEDEEDGQHDIALLEKQLEQMKDQISAIKKCQKKKTPPAPNPKNSKSKSGGGGGGRRNSVAMPASISKKGGKKGGRKDKEVPYVTLEQKTELSERINNLPSGKMAYALKMIRENMPDLGSCDDEIELDIDELDPTTLYKLHTYVTKHAPPVKKSYVPPPPPPPPAAEPKSRAKVAPKSKKNKPMSAIEQEAKIQALQARIKNFDNPTPVPAAHATNGADSDSSDDDESSGSESEEE